MIVEPGTWSSHSCAAGCSQEDPTAGAADLPAHHHCQTEHVSTNPHCNENPIFMYFFSGNCAASVPTPQHIFPCSRIGRPILEIQYINLSQMYKCRNWETGHYNSVLEITVSFLGIHKWEPDLYIGFSFAVQGRPRLHPHTPVIRATTCRLY